MIIEFYIIQLWCVVLSQVFRSNGSGLKKPWQHCRKNTANLFQCMILVHPGLTSLQCQSICRWTTTVHIIPIPRNPVPLSFEAILSSYLCKMTSFWLCIFHALNVLIYWSIWLNNWSWQALCMGYCFYIYLLLLYISVLKASFLIICWTFYDLSYIMYHIQFHLNII